MNKTIVAVGVVGVLMGGLGGYLLSEQDGARPYGADTERGIHDMHQMPDGTMMETDETTTGAMHNMDHMMVTSERDFITGMIPHHEEAVATAKEVFARGGTTPAIKTLVENIIVAQEKEIADMKAWHEAWYGTTYVTSGTYTPMMRDLESLSGVELDQAFLEDMIMHHMGAIMMARSVEPYITHPEIKTLTEAIITSQSAEIETMREMLEAL
jgi:uncharacterized protein (DUF305 family)